MDFFLFALRLNHGKERNFPQFLNSQSMQKCIKNPTHEIVGGGISRYGFFLSVLEPKQTDHKKRNET